jgi:hypothetical protein
MVPPSWIAAPRGGERFGLGLGDDDVAVDAEQRQIGLGAAELFPFGAIAVGNRADLLRRRRVTVLAAWPRQATLAGLQARTTARIGLLERFIAIGT